MKTQLVFDTTDAQSILDSDNVGAYIRASDGTLIDKVAIAGVDRLAVDATVKDGAGIALTSTLVSGKQALDVNIVEGINVEVDLSHVDDSVRLGDGTSFFTSTTVGPDIGLDVNLINASIAVTATDLDIRDLSAAQDSVASWTHDGTGTAITSTVVGADTGLDVNLINASLTVNDAALANTAIANAANTLAVANTAQDVVASPLANRKYLWIQNYANKEIYVGASGVTAANGFPLSPKVVLELRAGAAIDIEFVGRTGETPEIRTLELS